MIPGEEPEDFELPSEITICVPTMPYEVFSTLFHGLCVIAEWWVQGGGLPPGMEQEISNAQDWLNFTMQGKEVGEWEPILEPYES